MGILIGLRADRSRDGKILPSLSLIISSLIRLSGANRQVSGLTILSGLKAGAASGGNVRRFEMDYAQKIDQIR